MSTLRVDNLRGQTADGTNRYVVQVVNGSSSGARTQSTSTSYADISGMSVTITPLYTTSKVLIVANFPDTFVTNTDAANSLYLKIVRNINGGSFSDVCQVADRQGITTPTTQEFMCSMSYSFLDSPATTDTCIYKGQLKSYNTNQVNVGQQSSGLVNITAMEIAQ
tara:strand:- start:979 stop:1473 length:495 start_codon:yes stop_codon:yes gene_type:complete